ncbi:MAG: hypothetical protein MRJ68_10355 [Nitrospira sp.]|nr:hypothetical protein [Nitrospira sp.]
MTTTAMKGKQIGLEYALQGGRQRLGAATPGDLHTRDQSSHTYRVCG